MKAPSAVLVFVAALLILLTSMWPLGVDGHTIHGKPGLVLPVLHVSDALHACRVHPGARKTAVVRGQFVKRLMTPLNYDGILFDRAPRVYITPAMSSTVWWPRYGGLSVFVSVQAYRRQGFVPTTSRVTVEGLLDCRQVPQLYLQRWHR